MSEKLIVKELKFKKKMQVKIKSDKLKRGDDVLDNLFKPIF